MTDKTNPIVAAGKKTQFGSKSGPKPAAAGRNGGIKSGVAKRQKKLLKEIVNELLDSEIQTKDGPMNAGAAISMAQLRKALQGDAKAYEVLRDTAGQKPVEKILISDVSADVMSEIDDLVNAAAPTEPVSQVNQTKTKKSTPKDGAEWYPN